MTGIKQRVTHFGACYPSLSCSACLGRIARIAGTEPARLAIAALDDRSARRLFRSLLLVTALVVGAGLISTLLLEIGLSEPLHLAVSFILMISATCGLLVAIWGERRAITQLITGRAPVHAQRNDLGGLFAANWHVFATCIVLA